MPIDSVEELRAHIALAISVEMSTIPPYLYAYYSIEDQASEAAVLIRSIVAEEMLHLALATNLLLAVGGQPSFRSSSALPVYPSPMAHHRPELMLALAPCSISLVRDTFMTIEQPEARGAPPEEDEFETLGQFYHALELALERLSTSGSLFAEPQLSRQLANHAYYGVVPGNAENSGGLMRIDDVASAEAAIEIIIHQGEGLADHRWADPSHQELTHYYKLERISSGVSPLGPVRPAPMNPRGADYPADVRAVSDLFNALYRLTFLTLDAVFAPGDDKSATVDRLYTLMSDALAPTARYLMSLPLNGSLVAGPTFEVFEFGAEPVAETRELAARVAAAHPGLRSLVALLEAF